MATLWGKTYSKKELNVHCNDLGQIAGIEPFEFTDGNQRGTRSALFHNGSGLQFTVLPDRGMSIGDLSFSGIPLSFRTGAGFAHPSYFNPSGNEWLRSWPAGFLTVCGLQNVGSSCTENGTAYGLHGRIASIPASEVTHGRSWVSDSEYRLCISGKVRENIMFGENLLLTRTIWSMMGTPVFCVEDTIENDGHSSVPLMFLQHINLGFPLVNSTAELLLPDHTVQPRDKAAEKGLQEYRQFSAPVKGYAEQVFYLDFRNSGDTAVVAFVNKELADGIGVVLRYKKSDYPCFAEWKMMGAGAYVVGMEPSNCHVQGRVNERERGTLAFIEPGETVKKELRVEIAAGEHRIAALRKEFNDR